MAQKVSVLQCVAVCCSVLQCVLQCDKCVAVCCRVLQSVGVCCRDLHLGVLAKDHDLHGCVEQVFHIHFRLISLSYVRHDLGNMCNVT